MSVSFPPNFLWGAACAAYQCEGTWESDGKGSSIWDEFCHAPGHIRNGDTGDTACDSYRRTREDIGLVSALGVKAYRFSVSWPRVLPQGRGRVNTAGLDHYDRFVDDLLSEGIAPWITLYHWDLPSALQAEGGWQSRDAVDAFTKYSALVARRLGDRVRHFLPINEPQCIAKLGYGTGEHAPGLRLPPEEVARVLHHLALAQSLSTDAIRASASGPVAIGSVTCGRLCCPQSDTPQGAEAAYRATFGLGSELHDWAFTHNIFLDSLIRHRYDQSAPEFLLRFADTVPQSDWSAMRTPDFLGLNIYNGELSDDGGNIIRRPEGFPVTATKWPVTPEVMRWGVRHIYRRYGLPIYITENGLSCNDRVYRDGAVHDGDRIDFLRAYLAQLRVAMGEGVPVKGYFHWSLMDNFEWALGYDERFGLYYTDYVTKKRIPKDSAAWFARVVRTGSLPD